MEIQKDFSFLRRIRPRKGFTLIELLIFSAILIFLGVTFVAILVIVTRVQVRQSAAAEVNQQSQFLTQTIQYYVQNARLVDMTADTSAGTLKLRESDPTKDPTYVFLGINITNGLIGYWKLDEGSGTSTADSSGNGHPGTLANSPTWTTGKINNALTFSKASSHGAPL
jgi:type II secretory pathway pseudopilin PulG